MSMSLGTFRRESISKMVGLILFLVAAAILFKVSRPSPSLSLDHHWQVFGTYATAAALLLLATSWMVGRRYRIAVAAASVLILCLAALAHPVCVLIPETARPAFETVIPLQERAARGEPFCQLEGRWYQCKSFISRAFFF